MESDRPSATPSSTAIAAPVQDQRSFNHVRVPVWRTLRHVGQHCMSCIPQDQKSAACPTSHRAPANEWPFYGLGDESNDLLQSRAKI